MRGLSEKEILAQRKRGITTVTQFACTFRPKSIGIKRNKPLKRHLHALQAVAVRDKKVYVVRAPEIPTKTPRVYLDVEGLPDRDFHYLVGVIVEADGQTSVHSFWADDETEEKTIWFKLLDLLRDLGNGTIFHYGAYEKDYIKKMLRKYPSPGAPFGTTWEPTLFNVLAAIRTNVYFPTYSNGLKDIGKHLGMVWSGTVTSGIECIAARMRWEASKDPVIKGQIIEYNRRDCLAVRLIADFLQRLGEPQRNSEVRVGQVSEITVETHRRFGNVEFAVPEMDFLNRCARFDYQRSKVLLRSDPTVRASIRRLSAKSKTSKKANAEVLCEAPTECPFCGSKTLRLHATLPISKLVSDLKISRNGVKRWVVRFVTSRHLCCTCGKTFHSPAYPTKQPKLGPNLSRWAVYQNVALRLSHRDITSSINDLFAYSFSYSVAMTAIPRLARTYQETKRRMLESLLAGIVINADETKVRIDHSVAGYVWAFTNSHIVVYYYHSTREGSFVKETLGDFNGVLVSDFYAAYDSVTCHQQKCHVHLIRDINDDLLRHPFDEELKELARRYTLTLKPMVETIDKHGLKAYFLSKHKRNAGAFLDWIAKKDLTSEVAQGYQTRIRRYGDRLFTFLDYDGVPWNNNNAENALKLVASRRRLFGTTVSEAGLKDYLVFLSIYQTLRLQGISLLRFLLSGETDLENFVGSYRRR
jgi:hypothetical protein